MKKKAIKNINSFKGIMDKAMRKQVGKPLKKAEKEIKKAEKNNSRLADYDEKVRDPIIHKSKKKIRKPPKGIR